MIHDRPIPFRFAIPLGLLSVCLIMPAWADFETGMDAYNRQVYATALREWQPLAEQGQAEAQSNLGALYDEGLGVPQDYVKARQWYERAATQGYAPAQYNLGQLYANGQGVPQDYVQARQWYEKAAVQGLAEAQYNLGELYANGQGVPQDYGKCAAVVGESRGPGIHEFLGQPRLAV